MKTITKSDALKAALAVAGECKRDLRKYGLTSANCSRQYEGSTKWHLLSWEIMSPDFQVWGERRQHDDGRIRGSLNAGLENGDAYAAWLIHHFPSIAKRVDRLVPLVKLIGDRPVQSINLTGSRSTNISEGTIS